MRTFSRCSLVRPRLLQSTLQRRCFASTGSAEMKAGPSPPCASNHASHRALSISEFAKNELNRWSPTIPISNAFTPPASWYTDPEFFKIEAKTVFYKNWIQVGRVDQVAEKGSYISGNIMGEPYVVVRDSNGDLRAFFNVCRHHASKLLESNEGTLTEREIVCPYHGWTYTLEGRLKKATQIKGIKEFKATDYGLKPMHVKTVGPWIFIRIDPSPDAWDLQIELKPLEDLLSDTRYLGLKWIGATQYTLNCNWKVYVDNYCDGGYHVPYLHKKLDTQIDMNSYETKTFNKFSVQMVSSKKSEDPFVQTRIGSSAYYAFVYPNFMINRYGDTMDTNLVIPLSVDKTLVHFNYYFKNTNGKEVEEFIQKSMKLSDEVQREDEYISHMVQQGLSSSSFDVGRYAPNVEQAAYHFHTLLSKDFTAAIKP